MRKALLLFFVCFSFLSHAQTYHPLASSAFTQNWSNTSLVTTDNNWSGVPSIIGYRGDDLTTANGTNPQSILADGSSTPVNVLANQTNTTFSNGGVAEVEITNSTIALQGSGTADAPHLVIYLNTTGVSGIIVQYNLRDLDASADNAIQQFSLQYRIGNTGNFIDLPAGYVADATTTNTATQVTAVSVTLPNACENVAQLQLRIMTTNAGGNDELVGIDDINISGTSTPACTPPATQASATSISNITANSFDVTWTAVSGTNSLVVVKAGSSVSGTPVNGTAYTANTSFGAGGTIAADEYVVYAGTSNSVSVTGLTPGTIYHVAVFSYDAGSNCYQTTNAAIDNDVTLCAEPTMQVSTINITPATNTAIINWSGGNGGSSLVLINSTNTFTTPTDGTVYTGNTTYSGGQQTIYSGTASTVNVSGLAAGTTYYATVYTFNNCSGTPDYLAAGNTVQSFTTTSGCVAGIPASYYSTITSQTCAALKTELSSIISAGFVRQNYGDLDNIHFLTTDDRLSDDGLRTIVWDMYSDNPGGAEPYEYTFSQFNIGSSSDGEGNGWNKEHSFPNSWFSASSSTNNDPGSDLHHIYPTDMDVNGLRSNYPFGKVQTATTTTANGSKLGSSAIAFGSYAGPVFEPIDAYKGDFARATLYMVTRYQSQQPSWESLQAGGDVVMDGTTYPSIEIDYLQMLLSWHNLDPVSQKEIDRNNSVYCYQFNRNPFIDHPEYVSQIWSSSCGLALPIDLTTFTAQLTERGVALNWKVENARGFSHFAVERSINGGAYQTLGSVTWVNGQDTYSFTDAAANISGKLLYRLKMVDANNVFKYSKIAAVQIGLTATIFPNPATDKLTLFFKNKTTSTSKATIIDMYGRSVKSVVLPAGVYSYNLVVSSLTPGRYSFRIADGTEVKNLPFIIVR